MMKGFRSQNVPWKGLPPLKSVRHLPRDLIVHMRFVIGKDDGALLCTYYAEEREERDGNWTFWGVVRDSALRRGCFSLSEMRSTVLSHGAALRRDRGFMKRPMAKVPELEGARRAQDSCPCNSFSPWRTLRFPSPHQCGSASPRATSPSENHARSGPPQGRASRNRRRSRVSGPSRRRPAPPRSGNP